MRLYHHQSMAIEGLRSRRTSHLGWACLLLDRARYLINHGPAHRGANGAAMPTDEDGQFGHFFFNHAERGATSPPTLKQTTFQ